MEILFEFFLKLNHSSEKAGWIETTAVFTGKMEKASVGKPGHYKTAAYNEYEIIYHTNDKERRGWYIFNPLPDPDPEDIKGTSMKIQYDHRKPWLFKRVND